jgi:hypothetical protein
MSSSDNEIPDEEMERVDRVHMLLVDLSPSFHGKTVLPYRKWRPASTIRLIKAKLLP